VFADVVVRQHAVRADRDVDAIGPGHLRHIIDEGVTVG
jgi:hypothetical protein